MITVAASTGEGDWLSQLEEHRQERNVEYKAEDSSPFKQKKARRKFKQLYYFAPDSTFCVDAKVLKFENPDTLKFATSAGTVKEYLRYASLQFTLKEKPLSLEVFRSISNLKHPVYGSYLFLPFTDLTSGEASYGGGRYLDLKLADIKEEAGQEVLRLDFNYAYNPYCAYSEGWFCPIPPASNSLDIRVEAGEKNYTKH